MENTNPPKIFISYSWSSEEHEKWVRSLAERLRFDGIDAILDKWDLKLGHDMIYFMRQIESPDIIKVLCICDKEYKEKADERQGGVGIEAEIISKEIDDKPDKHIQEKVIPLMRDRDFQDNFYLPVFLNNLQGIDFSCEEKFDEKYKELVKNIYGKPLFEKPPLGIPPPFITNDNSSPLKTANIVKNIKDAIENGKNLKRLINNYCDCFTDALEDFRIDTYIGDPKFDELVIKSITDYLPYRDEFIDLVYDIYDNYSDDIYNKRFMEFFEGLIKYNYYPREPFKLPYSYNRKSFDNYKFILYELFLYFIAILIKLERYKDASDFIHADYFYTEYLNRDTKHEKSFIFNEMVTSLNDDRNKRLNLNRKSVTGDTIKERANPKIDFNMILNVDALIYYLTLRETNDTYKNLDPYVEKIWVSYVVCSNDGVLKIELFKKIESENHFERIKILFKVQTIDEFKEKILKLSVIDKCLLPRRLYSGLPELQEMINLNKIGTID
ncbi:MAG: toll/interleukin-1 receptor domain-containing protein [Nitrospirae bacterium]|nr:toll/interleukin-1 receptor domain-containing protein [Nitrospirota bacterium]MBF0542704.1 toll/interleukin-1 receptor domain-containing protein [Nitrospirota bacterium]